MFFKKCTVHRFTCNAGVWLEGATSQPKPMPVLREEGRRPWQAFQASVGRDGGLKKRPAQQERVHLRPRNMRPTGLIPLKKKKKKTQMKQLQFLVFLSRQYIISSHCTFVRHFKRKWKHLCSDGREAEYTKWQSLVRASRGRHYCVSWWHPWLLPVMKLILGTET